MKTLSYYCVAFSSLLIMSAAPVAAFGQTNEDPVEAVHIHNERIRLLTELLVEEVTIGGATDPSIPGLTEVHHPRPGYGPRARFITEEIVFELQERANDLPFAFLQEETDRDEAVPNFVALTSFGESLCPFGERDYADLRDMAMASPALQTDTMRDDRAQMESLFQTLDPNTQTLQNEGLIRDVAQSALALGRALADNHGTEVPTPVELAPDDTAISCPIPLATEPRTASTPNPPIFVVERAPTNPVWYWFAGLSFLILVVVIIWLIRMLRQQQKRHEETIRNLLENHSKLVGDLLETGEKLLTQKMKTEEDFFLGRLSDQDEKLEAQDAELLRVSRSMSKRIVHLREILDNLFSQLTGWVQPQSTAMPAEDSAPPSTQILTAVDRTAEMEPVPPSSEVAPNPAAKHEREARTTANGVACSVDETPPHGIHVLGKVEPASGREAGDHHTANFAAARGDPDETPPPTAEMGADGRPLQPTDAPTVVFDANEFDEGVRGEFDDNDPTKTS